MPEFADMPVSETPTTVLAYALEASCPEDVPIILNADDTLFVMVPAFALVESAHSSATLASMHMALAVTELLRHAAPRRAQLSQADTPPAVMVNASRTVTVT